MENNDYLKFQLKMLWRAIYIIGVLLVVSIIFNIVKTSPSSSDISSVNDRLNKYNVRLYNDSVRLNDADTNITNLYHNLKPLLKERAIQDDAELFSTPPNKKL